MRGAIIIVVAGLLAGCAQAPPPEPVKPTVVRVTGSDFCLTIKGLFPPVGKPTWSARDTQPSITQVRRLAAAVDSRCAPSAPKPTS